MRSIGAAGVSVLVLAAASQLAFAQSRSIPTDMAGRSVRDAMGQPILYADAPATASMAAAPTSSSLEKGVPALRASKPGTVTNFQASSPSYAEVWRTASLGTGIGGSGIVAADLDNDGDDDLVLGGGRNFGLNAFWSIVAFDEATGEYEITWQSRAYDSVGITALRIVEAGDTKQVWVGLSDGRIDVVDGLTRDVLATLAVGGESINDLVFAEANNDGAADVTIVTESELLLYDPVTLTLEQAFPYGGSKLAIGNVDADSAVEVVLNTGVVLELSGADALVQWSTTDFGAHIALGDIDGDGMAELVAAEAWEIISAWDLDSQSTRWTISASHDIGAMRLIDIAGDAAPELIYGDGQWGAIHAIDTTSRAELWTVANPEHGVTEIAAIDSDNDGQRELIWGAGWSSTGPDYLFVHDLHTRSFEWQSTDWFGPYEAVDIGDADADGQPEIVVASSISDSGYGDGLVMVFDAATEALEWRSETTTFGGFAWTGIHDLKLANVDDDAQLEIVVGTDRLYDGALYVFDGITHEKQTEAFYETVSPIQVLDTADLTSDGRPEVIAGIHDGRSTSPGDYIYVIDPLTGAIVWDSAIAAPGFSTTDIKVADVGAAGMDLLAANSAIHAIRWSDKRHLTSATTGYRSVDAGDVSGSLEREVLAGRDDGGIDVLDGETLSVIATHEVCAGSVTALEPLPAKRVLVTCGSDLVVYDFPTEAVVGLTESGATNLGRNGALVTGNVDGRAVVLAGGSQAVKFADLSGNRIPLLNPLSVTFHWRDSRDLELTATDADGDTLTFEIVSLPRLGSAVWLDRELGRLRYTSDRVDKGRDTFVVRVSDGFQYSSPGVVEIILENFAPEADTLQIELHWRGEQAVELTASDPDDDPLSFELTADPSHGTAAVEAATGVMTYTPSEAYVGQDVLSYAVSDGADTATDTVQILLTNTSPKASAREYVVSPGAAVASRFPAEDADGDPLTYSVLREPEQGQLAFEPETGLFEYLPAANGSGTDSATFAASDGIAESQGSIAFRYPAAPPQESGGGGGGGSCGWLLPALMAFLWSRRRMC